MARSSIPYVQFRSAGTWEGIKGAGAHFTKAVREIARGEMEIGNHRFPVDRGRAFGDLLPGVARAFQYHAGAVKSIQIGSTVYDANHPAAQQALERAFPRSR